MVMAYVTGIHGTKRSMNLVLISHKYLQRNTFGLNSVTDMKTLFHCIQKGKKLNAV